MMLLQPGATEPPELMRVGGDWYVHAASSLADDRTRVLKDGEMFAIFDRYGDIQPIGLGEQGIFSAGTRHVSHLSLRVGGKRPLLLSSSVSEDNTLLTVDLANVPLDTDDGTIPAETVHILRTIFLWQGVCHERLDLRNYGPRSIGLNLSHGAEADFRDLFEVRGMRRSRRGRHDLADVNSDRMRLSYEGLDDIRRTTEIDWSADPSSLDPSSVEFEMELRPGETRTICFRIHCYEGSANPGERETFETAFHRARAARHSILDSTCAVTTSNDQFNEWLTRSHADLMMLLTTTEHGAYPYAGIPWFSTAFGRDGIITALEALWLQPAIAAGVLRYLAASQATEFDPGRDAQPGKILHETRLGEMATLGEVPFARYYGTVDATPLFVVLAGAYYEATADATLIEEIWPHVERALEWIDRNGDADRDGFLDYTPNPRGLVHQGWKDSEDSVFHEDGSSAEGPIALCEVQAYVYAAKRAAAQLASALGFAARASAYDLDAGELRARFGERFWNEEIGTFALALDGHKRPCLVRTSNAGHALFGGIATAEQARGVATQLLSEASYSGWGIRTLASTEARYNPMSYHNGSVWPHDNALLAAGLARYGHKREVLGIMDGLFAASTAVDAHRLPELICGFARRPGAGPTLYAVAAAPQAWASAAVFMLLQSCLGMSVDAVNMQIRLDHPVLPEWLETVSIRGLRVGAESLDLEFTRYPDDVGVVVSHRTGNIDVLTAK